MERVVRKNWFITTTEKKDIVSHIQEHFPDLDARRIISSGGAWLEKKRIKDKKMIIDAGKTLRIYYSTEQHIRYTISDEHIIYEDADILATYKENGVRVQAAQESLYNNLTNSIYEYLLNTGISYNPTPVTRLDLNVSGIVLFGKHKQAEKQLMMIVRERLIKKMYTAVVHHHANNPRCFRAKDTVAFDRKAGICITKQDGKTAHTLFIKTDSNKVFDTYTVILFSGRRHQIRFHAAKYISPIIGDQRYGSSIRLSSRKIALLSCGYNFKIASKKYRIRTDRESFITAIAQEL